MKSILAFSLLFFSSQAFADHSLEMAMENSESLNRQVQYVQQANNVVCDIRFSNQMEISDDAGSRGWKQVALCFRSNEDMEKARHYFANGDSTPKIRTRVSFDSAPNLVGVLVAKYLRDIDGMNITDTPISVDYL